MERTNRSPYFSILYLDSLSFIMYGPCPPHRMLRKHPYPSLSVPHNENPAHELQCLPIDALMDCLLRGTFALVLTPAGATSQCCWQSHLSLAPPGPSAPLDLSPPSCINLLIQEHCREDPENASMLNHTDDPCDC